MLNRAFLAWSHTNWHVFFSGSCLGSRIELMILPKYLWSVTSSIDTALKCSLDFLGLPNTITLVLISFTIIWMFEQNCFRPSSWICRPRNVSENKIKSSDHNKWAIILLLIQIPCADDRYDSRSAIYFLNNIPLATPPWLTPRLFMIVELTRPLFFTRNAVLLYKLLNVSITGPCHPPFMRL